MAGRVVLVTGANRGLGRALVTALLDRDVEKVYATARDVSTLVPVTALDPQRVVPFTSTCSTTPRWSVRPPPPQTLPFLFNNAGVLHFGAGLDIDRDELLDHFVTNTLGTFDVIRAFVPAMSTNGGGRVLVVMSLQSMAARPGSTAYSVSKAALHSLCQSLRPALADLGIGLSGVYPGAIDTDMLRNFDMPKISASTVAEGILDGVEAGDDDIFPDPDGLLLGNVYLADPRRLQEIFDDSEVLRAYLTSAHSASLDGPDMD